jgi:hypothetical protein
VRADQLAGRPNKEILVIQEMVRRDVSREKAMELMR